jgi:hypothetical protein
MVAPTVALDSKTDVAVAYSPAFGTNVGVATVGDVAGATVIFKRTVLFVPLPQHLMCRTCGPVAACTIALNDVATMVVAPWSTE